MTQVTTIHALTAAQQLFARYDLDKKVENYFGLQAYLALAQLAVAKKDDVLLERVKDIMAQYPDHVEHPRYNFEYYRCGGNCQAYLAYLGENGHRLELIREYAEKTLAHPVDRNGLLIMPRMLEMERVWIDYAHATTPFLVMAGVALHEPKYIDYALFQLFGLYDLFEDPKNHLLHQSRGFMPDVSAISQDHWSRGNGWGLLGLSDTLQFLPADHPRYQEVTRRLRRHLEALLPYQTNRGLWRQSIAEKLAWEESSGTAMIAYAMGVAMRLGVVDQETFRAPFERAIDGLMTYCVDAKYNTYRCCPGCLCPGEGEMKGTVQAYITEKAPTINDPHSYGPMMLALVEAYRNGYVRVPVPGVK